MKDRIVTIESLLNSGCERVAESKTSTRELYKFTQSEFTFNQYLLVEHIHAQYYRILQHYYIRKRQDE